MIAQLLRRALAAGQAVAEAFLGTPTYAKQRAAVDLPYATPITCGHDHERHPDFSHPAGDPFNHRAASVAVAPVVDGLVSRGGADRAAQADGSSTATGGDAA